MNRMIKTMGVIGIAALAVACGDDTEDDTPNINPDDNGNSPSLEEQAVTNGQINTVDSTGLMLDAATLAVTGVSPASPATMIPSSAGLVDADYYGAVDPTATTPFWQGWTVIDSGISGNLPGANFHPLEAEISGGDITGATSNACAALNGDFADGGTITVFGESFEICIISQDILADTTLQNDHIFVLDGTINVGNGGAQGTTPATAGLLDVTLTIPAGTQVYAAAGDFASLVATRGSQINVTGSAAQPVIMGAVTAFRDNSGAVIVDGTADSSINDDVTELTGRGDWGGLVLSGFGVTSSGSDVQTEAAPATPGRFFAGTDNTDSSGTIEYLVVAETGFPFEADSEVQGITIEAAGSGTTLDFVQITNSDDDCIEFFGGAAVTTHLICNGMDDDGLDIDLAYVGTIQFVIIRQGDDAGNHGIEADSNDEAGQALSTPVIANVTVLGNAGNDSGTNGTKGARYDDDFAGTIYRSAFIDDTAAGGAFEDGCFDINDRLDDGLMLFDAVFSCTPGDAAAP